MTNTGPVLGTTLYSFTNEWQQKLFTLDGLVEKVAALGLGPALEVVGFQSFRDFPDVSDETAKNFRALLDKHSLIPSCLSGNSDVGRLKGRLMTQDEIVAYIERQLVSAKKLGFPVLRIQAFVGPKVMEALAPIAERYGVQVAGELHSPLSADHPEVVALRECYDRLGSPYVGFVPDFSSTMTAPPEGHWQTLRDDGAPEALITEAKAIWHDDQPVPAKFGALAEAAAKHGVERLMGRINRSLTMFGHAPGKQWAVLFPSPRHIHGKYYQVDATGNEPAIPYAEIMALLKREGYSGTISAEWEGQAFVEDAIGFEQAQAWHAMCRRLLSA